MPIAGPPTPPADAGHADDLGLRSGRAPAGRRSGFGLADVIGGDDRREVLDASVPPWRYICSLDLILGNSSVGIGTAWFAGPRMLVTAGHCLLHPHVGGSFDAVEVIPARSRGSEPFGRMRIAKENFRLHPEWKENFVRGRDAGALLLPEPISGIDGWFAAETLEPEALQGWLVNVAGYPNEVEVAGRQPAGGDQLWVHSDGIDGAAGETIEYVIDTSGGQSGGPVFIYRDSMIAPIAIGIHASGVKARLAGLPDERNSATRIDDDLMRHLEAWRRESET